MMSSKAVKEKTLPKGWREATLDSVCNVIVSPVDKKTIEGETPVKLCNYTDVYYKSIINADIEFMSATATSQEIEKFSLMENDVVVTKDSETSDDIGIPAYVEETIQNLLCGYHLTILRPKKGMAGKYIYYALLSPRVRYDFYKFANGITRFGLTNESYRRVKVLIPSLPEQQAIAETLQTWDTAIEKTEKLITEKEKQFGWFRQKVLTGEVRFQNFSLPWKLQDLSGLLTEHKLTSNGNEEIHSVSVHQGVINQIEHMGRSFSASKTNHYHLVNPGDLVYTRSPTGDFPLGIIKQSKLEISVIVSPLYAVFKPRTIELGNFLDAYFESPKSTKNYLNPVVQRGAKNTISCKSSAFLSRRLFLPTDKKEIQSISGYIDTAKKEIDLLKQAAEQYRTQKYGLMQKLLSGKLRIEV